MKQKLTMLNFCFTNKAKLCFNNVPNICFINWVRLTNFCFMNVVCLFHTFSLIFPFLFHKCV